VESIVDFVFGVTGESFWSTVGGAAFAAMPLPVDINDDVDN
jgi:hypothetical protein